MASGKPIDGATVSMSPNVVFFGDLVIPGWEMYSNDRVRSNGTDGEVELLAVKVRGMVGRLDNRRNVNETLVIPAQPDGFGIRVTTSEPTEEEKRRAAERDIYVSAPAVYVDILSGDGASPKQILQNLVEQKSLVSLKQLLLANQYDALTPLKFDAY